MCSKNDSECSHNIHNQPLTNEINLSAGEETRPKTGRRNFLKTASLLGGSAFIPPAISMATPGDDYHAREISKNKAVQKGKADHFTILHTSDIHAQINTHDEFFLEKGSVVYKKRGGMAVLKTMLNSLRLENPGNTILIDGGDCFQGGGVAALTEGRGIIPLMNNIGYDLLLPGNWEVVYGKENMRKDLGGYTGQKICANMFHEKEGPCAGELIFPPYWVKMVAGVKIGFIGYNDPLTPKRQSPAYSFGIKFTKPEVDVAYYIDLLKNYEQCAMVFLVTHMGLAQQVDLANKPEVQGVDYILGADTHERVRKPIQGTYAKVTEPGAFGSFIAKLDVVIENGIIKDQNYELLDVDPERYKPDEEMLQLVEKISAPYKSQLNLEIGRSKTTLTRYYVIETNMDNMVTDALAWKFPGIDVVISNGFRFCPPLVPDPATGEAIITNDYLWSMLPVDSAAKKGEVTGEQIWNWLEKELRNVFSKDPAKRFGGWVIRFQGMKVEFTMNNAYGKRLQKVEIQGLPLNRQKTYSILACEREGDPEDTLCRIEHVKNPKVTSSTLHGVMREYLAVHSPVSPKIEGRIKATDAPADLLSQLEGYDYQFI
jgi:2',3'-cyclic-nucleotide 2'-phosphodiesterase (5'-nucleotidase family)